MKEKSKLIKFEQVKDKILIELRERAEKINFSESVTLIDGFFNEPFSKEMSDSFVLGGPTVPMIMLVGNDTGRIYFFALKAFIKDLTNYES